VLLDAPVPRHPLSAARARMHLHLYHTSHIQTPEAIIKQQFNALSMKKIAQLRNNFETIAQTLNGTMTSSSSMSGTDMIYFTTKTLFAYVGEQFGIELTNVPEWSCEIEGYKRAFIRRHHDVVVFPNVMTLSSGTHNDCFNEPKTVTRSVFHAAGVECDSVSAANNKRAMHAHCIVAETGRTGATWKGCKNLVVTLRPAFVLIENVKGLIKQEHLEQIIRSLNEAIQSPSCRTPQRPHSHSHILIPMSLINRCHCMC